MRSVLSFPDGNCARTWSNSREFQGLSCPTALVTGCFGTKRSEVHILPPRPPSEGTFIGNDECPLFVLTERRGPLAPVVEVSAAEVGAADTDRVGIRPRGVYEGQSALAVRDDEVPSVGDKEVPHLPVDPQRCRSRFPQHGAGEGAFRHEESGARAQVLRKNPDAAMFPNESPGEAIEDAREA